MIGLRPLAMLMLALPGAGCGAEPELGSACRGAEPWCDGLRLVVCEAGTWSAVECEVGCRTDPETACCVRDLVDGRCDD